MGESLADDVVQETYLAAQRHPPLPGSRVRAWLATVARNAARMVLRSQASRQAHERAAARPDRTRSTIDAVAEVELHGRVVQEILELDEPYRLTVIHRYFDNLPHREIARIMGVPVATVRVRLRRALAQLRGRMDRGWGAGWALALLPAAAPRSFVATTGATVMGKKAAVVVIAWALVATSLYVKEIAAPSRAARAPAARAAPNEATEPRKARGFESPRDLSASEERQEFMDRWLGSRSGLIHGRFFGRDRKPLNEVVSVRFDGTLPDGSKVTYEVSSDPQGRFEVPNMRYPLDYSAECSAPQAGVQAKRGVHVGDLDQEIRIRVLPRSVATGSVVDRSGRPVPGALVYIDIAGAGRWNPNRCDEAGRFGFALPRNPKAGQAVRVAAVAPGHLPAFGEATLSGKYDWKCRVVLGRGPLIRVRFVDEHNQPVKQAQVTLYAVHSYPYGQRPDNPGLDLHRTINAGPLMSSSDGNRNVTEWMGTRFGTDESGAVEGWLPMAPERLVIVLARGANAPWIREIPGPIDSVDLGTVRLPVPTPPLTLRVVDGKGQPVRNAMMMFTSLLNERSPLLRFGRVPRADAEGRIKTALLEPGRRYVVSLHDPNRSRTTRVEFVATDGAVLKVE